MPRVTGWQRLGVEIKTSRARLGMLTQAQLATRAGIGKRTVSDLERGARANYSPDTLAAVEAALGWSPGTVRVVLAGRRPDVDPDLARVVAMWPRMSSRDRRIVVAVVDALVGRR